jgi:hypothetical protein
MREKTDPPAAYQALYRLVLPSTCEPCGKLDGLLTISNYGNSRLRPASAGEPH